MDFFYPNFYNDMWRVFGIIFYNDPDKFFNKSTKTIDKEGIKGMLREHLIGIGETATEVIRTKDNASDKYLQIVKPVNLGELMEKIPECNHLVTTGEKAASVISSLTATRIPEMGEKISCRIMMNNGEERDFYHWRMPSTSRAYPMKLQSKASYYLKMLSQIGIIQ